MLEAVAKLTRSVSEDRSSLTLRVSVNRSETAYTLSLQLIQETSRESAPMACRVCIGCGGGGFAPVNWHARRSCGTTAAGREPEPAAAQNHRHQDNPHRSGQHSAGG